MSTLTHPIHRHRAAAPDDGALELHDAHVSFAGVKAIDGVDLRLDRGEILGLIGPNGAGKTTLVNVLSGFQPPSPGRMTLDGVDVTGWAPRRLAHAGLSRTFQAVRLFARLTVRENVEVGLVCAGASRRAARSAALELLERVGLAAQAPRAATDLSYGDERKLGIARALATAPRFVLLDEPAAGLDEAESEELLATLAAIRADLGCGLLVIEHDMALIMRLCDRVHVLDYGRTLAVGTPAEVRRDPAVLAAYLGTEEGSAHAPGA